MGATKNNTGGHLKIRGDKEKFNYEGAYKISWGFEKIEGARLSGGLLQRGVLQTWDNSLPQGNSLTPGSTLPLTLVTVHMSFSLSRGNFERRVTRCTTPGNPPC